jgi:hypothetical protein
VFSNDLIYLSLITAVNSVPITRQNPVCLLFIAVFLFKTLSQLCSLSLSAAPDLSLNESTSCIYCFYYVPFINLKPARIFQAMSVSDARRFRPSASLAPLQSWQPFLALLFKGMYILYLLRLVMTARTRQKKFSHLTSLRETKNMFCILFG